ncbi:MAG: replication initiator protein [Microviridae sp.]|nr:MAG: replication initiator protein [Microviridae sp.]
MTCFRPLNAFKGFSKIPEKTSITFRRSDSWRGQKLQLPCGQCVGCRLERSRQWAIRCMHEASLYENNCFLTLTYNDKNLPSNNSLIKTEFPSFMKRVRKKYGAGIRYYHCGEYGEQFGRPHYHALLFNHDFQDKKPFSEKNGISVYTSSELSSLWTKGFSVIGSVTFESAAYVARYIMKKITGEQAANHYGLRIPEFTTMSRGSKKLGTGGIGKGWFDKFKSDVYPRDAVIVRGHPSRPPRFYDTLLQREDWSTFELLKIKREKAGLRTVEDVIDGVTRQVSDNDSFRLPIREVCKLAEIQNLKRPLEE